MSVMYLQHATSLQNLDNILKNGLRFNKKSEKTISLFGDNGDRYIWFDLIADIGEIKYTTAGVSVSNEVTLVLDFQKLYRYVKKNDEMIVFSKDYVKFEDDPSYSWVSYSNKKPTNQEIRETLEVVLEGREDTEPLDIKPFLRYVYRCGDQGSRVKDILKRNSLGDIRVYAVDTSKETMLTVNKILEKDDKETVRFINSFIAVDIPYRLKKLLCYQLFFMTHCYT